MLRRHAPDVVSLVFGVVFAGLAAIWLLNETDVINNDGAWLAGPVILIVAGVLGLVLAVRPSRAAAEAPPAPWTPSVMRDAEPTVAVDTEPTVAVDVEDATEIDSGPDRGSK
jgi:hypothetical protein